ncbi:MAG: response regulator [Acidimicrobiia bacterium]|nr:response regulator [Acidimicrobiia bacterium]
MERDGEMQALRRLSEASLRINEGLDLDAVLQGVLDSARSLTGASYGAFVLVDDSGEIEDFLSSGLTAEEAQRMWSLADGMRFFELLSRTEGPLRLPDLLGHIRSQGLPNLQSPVEVGSLLPFLAAPVVYMGNRVGNIFVAERQAGGEFSREDEETLVMFGAQAALVIANARRHRDELRARADLEALIDTTPVGVVVLDAGTGTLVSVNREMLRIVDGLRYPDQPLEHLLEVITVRRADGSEISLEELPLAQALSAGETVRAEEIVLRVPDGRNMRALLNATPIRSEEGRVESWVVVLQDMTPLEEQERLRAEFLAMVSHELRAPLTSVKGSVATLLGAPAPLNPAEMQQFHRIIDSQVDRMHLLISDLLDVARIETGALAVSPGPTDVAVLIGEARNAFRSGGGRHRIEIELAEDLPWVMADRARMVQVLDNLLSNAARNSPESSPIRVSTAVEDVHVAVSVSDRGRGIPAESLPHLFRMFSRIDGEEPGRGTGLGLAVCEGIVEAHGGRIWVESDGPGLGARFTFTIPTVEQAGYVSPARPVASPARSPRRRTAEQVRVLAVDDDPRTLRHVRDALVKSDYTPIVTTDPEEALRLVEKDRPHLVLLDLVLPGADGMELMKDIAMTRDVPVIFLSAYGQEQLVARALDEGAADYLIKPFSPVELAARIRAALRRRETPEPSAPYVLGDLTIDYAERRASLAGRPVPLTAIEYRTLAELASHAGRVLTYEHLLRRVWRLDPDIDTDLRPMRTAISSLRRKLGDDADDPTYIFTQLRVGYRMPKGETREQQER